MKKCLGDNMQNYESEKPWNKDMYALYATENFDGHRQYVEATKDIVLKFETILKKTANYEELKEELTVFLKDRKKFIKFADNYKPGIDPVP